MKSSPSTAEGIETGADPDLDWSRARRPEQKQARTDAILAAACTLIDSVGIEKTTLSAIAREASLSKANCYRYFENREAILLEVMLKETEHWIASISRDVPTPSHQLDIDAVAVVFVDTTLAQPRLCELASSLWAVLEHNVSEDVFANFKRRFNKLSIALKVILLNALPGLSEEQARQFGLFFLFFVGSAWPASQPSDAMRRVFAQAEFQGMQLDLRSAFLSHTIVLIQGFIRA